MTIRMASIEVLDYRKDGEVEARRVTGRVLRGDGRFSGDDGLPRAGAEGPPADCCRQRLSACRVPRSPMATTEVGSPPPAPFSRRQRDSTRSRPLGRADPPPASVQLTAARPQPASCRPPRSRPTTRPRTALSRSAMPFCSIARRWPVTRPSVDGISLLGRDLAVHQPPLRANTRGCIAIDLNHNPVMLASEQRQPSVPAHEWRSLDPRAEVQGSNFAIILSNQPVVPSEPLASSGVYRPVHIGA